MGTSNGADPGSQSLCERPNFFKADYDLVRNRLKEKNMESAVRGMEVNDAGKKFNGILREIIGYVTQAQRDQ